MKAHLDAVPAIDTHDHLWPFDKLPGYVETENGKGMNLAGLWRNSYLTRVKSGHALDRRAASSTTGGRRPSTISTTSAPPASTATRRPPSRTSTASTSTASPTSRPPS